MSDTLFATFFVFIILLLSVALYYSNNKKKEAFGMSPGTLVQLQTSHVPTEKELMF
jgi:hypothetical protein